MKNLQIAHKLMVMFGVVALIFALNTAVLLFELSGLNGVNGRFVSTGLPRIVQADAVNTATSDYQSAVQAALLASDDGARAVALARVKDRGGAIDDLVGKLQGPGVDAAERPLIEAFRAKWTRYVALCEQAMQLARQSRVAEGNRVIASSLPLFDSLSKDLSDFSDVQERSALESLRVSERLYRTGLVIGVGALILALAAMMGVLGALVRLIARPLTRMTVAMGQMAAGNRAVDVPVEPRHDEIGLLAKAMAGLRDQLALAEQAKQEQAGLLVASVGAALNQMAEGDLTTRITADLSGPFAELKHDFNQAISSLEATVESVAGAASGIHVGSSEIRAASDDLALRTEQQAASLERTSLAMSSVTAMVQETAKSAEEVLQSIEEAHRRAAEGSQVVERAVAAMDAIEGSSREIGSIINVIDGIAFQTNLLALNAGVEAARAGDAGKGFAVVATEVRALAQRSADAAREIKELISKSGEQVGQGVALVGDTGRMLSQIVGQVAKVNELVSSISEAAAAQATGLEQVNVTVGEMDRATQQNAAMVEESTAAARGLASEANELSGIVSRFRVSGGIGGQPVAPVAEIRPRPTVRPPAMAMPVVGATALAPAADADDWSAF